MSWQQIMLSSLKWKNFSPDTWQVGFGRDLVPVRPGFCCTSRWEKPKTTVNVLKSAIINLGKTQEYVIIYQELNLKRIDSTSAKAGEVLNAGSTGEKHRVMNLYICQTGISGVYLLVSRKV